MLQMRLRVPAVIKGLAVGIVVLGIGHFALAHREWDGWRLFNLSAEGSFGTWVAAVLGATAGLAALSVSVRRRMEQAKYGWWAILGLGMLAYSLDEVAMVHEGLAGFTDVIRPDTAHPAGGVAVIGYLLIPVFLIAMWGIWRNAESGSRGLIVGGLALFWIAGFGLEELENQNWAGRLPLTRGMDTIRADLIITGVQELGEMVAISMVLVGVLRHWAMTRQEVTVTSSLS